MPRLPVGLVPKPNGVSVLNVLHCFEILFVLEAGTRIRGRDGG